MSRQCPYSQNHSPLTAAPSSANGSAHGAENSTSSFASAESHMTEAPMTILSARSGAEGSPVEDRASRPYE